MALCSIAMAAGVLGVVAAVKGLFFRRRLCGAGGGGCHRGGFGPPWARGRRGWRGGPGGSSWLRAIFARLDTTPGQEREIRSAVEELQNRARDARDGLKGARADVARAIRGAEVDDAALGEASARADASSGQVKDAFAAALKRIHAILDDKQRERLAELLANGPGFGGWGGRWGGGSPYRG